MKTPLKTQKMKWVIPPGRTEIAVMPAPRSSILVKKENLVIYHNALCDSFGESEKLLWKAKKTLEVTAEALDPSDPAISICLGIIDEITKFLTEPVPAEAPVAAAPVMNPVAAKAPVAPAVQEMFNKVNNTVEAEM